MKTKATGSSPRTSTRASTPPFKSSSATTSASPTGPSPTRRRRASPPSRPCTKRGKRSTRSSSARPRRPRPELLLAPRAYTRRVSAEGFTEHLEFPQGKGYVPAGAFMGAAGGAACGDLSRCRSAVDGRARGRRGLRGFRLRRDWPPRDRRRSRSCRARRCSTPRASGTAAIAAELGGLSPGKLHAAELAADALHRALGLGRAGGAAVAARRRPHAGRDERRGRLGGGRAAHAASGEAVAVTLELWADEANDAEASCCSAHAVRVARALAHGMGMPHFTLDLRSEFRAGVVEPWLAGHAAGETPNPCVGCNGHVRLDAMLDVRRRARLPRPGHRSLRARERGRAAARAPPTRPRTRPTCCARCRRRRWRGCASRSAS